MRLYLVVAFLVANACGFYVYAATGDAWIATRNGFLMGVAWPIGVAEVLGRAVNKNGKWGFVDGVTD